MDASPNTPHIPRLIVPSKKECIFALALLSVLLVLAIFNSTLKAIYGYDLVIETIEATYSNVSILLEEGVFRYITSIVTWGAFGSVIYIVLWLLFVFLRDTRNEIVASSAFKHPDSFHQSDYWLSAFVRKLAQIASIIFGLGIVYTLFRLATNLFGIYENIDTSNASKATSTLIIATIWLLVFHILVIIYRSWTVEDTTHEL